MTFAICVIIILSVNLILALTLNHKILNEWEQTITEWKETIKKWENTLDQLEDTLDKLEQYELELSELKNKVAE